MDNEHVDKLLVAMIKLTEAIERLNQRLPCVELRRVAYQPPVDGAIGAEYGESVIIPD